MPRRTKYDVHAKVYIEFPDDEDRELILIGEGGIPYPYDARKALPRLLREIAAELEEMANGGNTAAGGLRAH